MKTLPRFFTSMFIIITIMIISACIPKAGQSTDQSTDEINTVQTGSLQEVEQAILEPVTGTKRSIDATKSKVEREGKKVIGGGHNGTVAIRDGFVLVNDNRIVGGEVTINMKSITVLDIPADDSSNVGLVNHLLGPDFFDTEQFPTALFVVTSVNNDNYPRIELTGTMTIKDQSHPETIIMEANEDMTQLSGSIEIDRTKYGVMYNSEKLLKTIKDRAISDMMSLKFTLTLVK